ncbi:MAG: aromatic-L-amino-acid/L-tryptophan decarboxylase [Acidobacteriota bacterium]|jgi:glutamate/tyrosine decarboxylase-like PLP-dependent enzyme|nr:aromatic-L-amino-acid/L-tryptophan decarboxylase [Acidobacteriota bacterium]
MDDTPETLELPAEEIRKLGYRIVDLLIDRAATLPGRPVTGWGGREQLEALFREPAPEQPRDPREVLDRLERDLLPWFMPIDHPRFFAFVPSPSNLVSVLGDALAAGLNPFLGTWFAGSGPAEIELVTLDWLRDLCGLPAEAGGLFVSGGSVANLTALHAARHVRLDSRGEDPGRATVYLSDQTHSSVERALAVLGFRPGQIRKLPADAELRLPLSLLEKEIAADRAAGKIPFCVVANAGTTNTGAVDPLSDLADLCRREDLWLHADGAYGAAAVLCERGRRALAGLERVDSLSLDPHKWLFQPIEIGCVLLRDRRFLHEAFTIHPEYLQDVHRDREAVNFCDYGIQLTRGFRALKLWMSIQVFGMDAFRRAVDRGFDLAETAERILRESPRWEVTTPAHMGVVSFRYVAPGRTEEELDALQTGIVDGLRAEGFALATSTRLRGRTALRLCTINPRTTYEDIRATIEHMARLGARLGRGL